MTEPQVMSVFSRCIAAVTGTRFLAIVIVSILILGVFDFFSFGKPRRPDPIDSITSETLGFHLFSNNGVFGFFRVSANKWTTDGNEPDRALESQFYGGVINTTIVHINHPGSHLAHRELRFSYFGVMTIFAITFLISFVFRTKRRLSPS